MSRFPSDEQRISKNSFPIMGGRKKPHTKARRHEDGTEKYGTKTDAIGIAILISSKRLLLATG